MNIDRMLTWLEIEDWFVQPSGSLVNQGVSLIVQL